MATRGTTEMTIGLAHYLTVSAILLVLGIFGIFLNRKNVIVILMSVELILLAVNLNFVALSSWLDELNGQIFAMFVLTAAAAEERTARPYRDPLTQPLQQLRGVTGPRRPAPGNWTSEAACRGHAPDDWMDDGPGRPTPARGGTARSPGCRA